MDVSDAKGLRSLEEENRRLMSSGGVDTGPSGAEGASGKKMVEPAAKCEAVAHLRNVLQMS
jgi:hypothetical protein